MLFNSIEFLIFFPIVVGTYFALPHRARWLWLLAGSYYFYMQWVPEYIVLIVLSTVVDYVACRGMADKATKAERKPYMWASVFVNLGLLFTFKYYNWVNENLTALAGQELLPFADVLLPVGISFYTLQTMSYTLDVYKGRLKPTKHFGIFALYVAFFPQLVAGPIERAPSLLPQFFEKHRFDYQRVVSGLQLIAWGLFKKSVVADRLGLYTSWIYGEPQGLDGPLLAMGTVFFCIQVYCDFSGYSDIAIGAARCMGFDLMTNFKRPFFSRNIEDLWGKGWHISLVSWLRDYVYNPLAYMTRRSSPWRKQSNVLIIFAITGLWHGAAWKYVVWGLVNGVYVLLHVITLKQRKAALRWTGLDRWPALHAGLSIAFTFTIFCFGSIFFVAKDLSDALYVIGRLPVGWTSIDLSATKDLLGLHAPMTQFALAWTAIAVLFSVEYAQTRVGSVRAWLAERPVFVRWPAYYALVLSIALFGVFERDEFIYFQF